MKINILHIINGYWSRDLYSLFISEMSKKNIFQTVFVPVRNKDDLGKYEVKSKNIKYLYAFIIKSVIYRIIFWLKIKKIVDFIQKEADLKKINLIHAHTLFSDGAAAYFFFKKYNIPYIITVRNTDMNIFYKYLFYLRPLGKKILINSKKIIFLSESYKQKLLNYYKNDSNKSFFSEKSVVIPNGINDFWHNKTVTKEKNKKKEDKFTFIFAGEFKRNKNIHSSIKVVENLRNKGYNCKFKAIGLGFNDNEKYVKELLNQQNGRNYIEFINAVNKEELRNLYNKADIFIMPSYKESFGLVYAEALSQGLPVIYTENEGFDKHFEEGYCGFAVNPYSVEDITDKAEQIIINFNKIQANCVDASKKFSWEIISDNIFHIYNEVLN